jgi:uncharacterized surface anchored protein
MTIRVTVLALLCGLLLAPAAALAQSAGDDQYADPFGDEEQQQTAPSTPQEESPAPAPAPATTPAPTAQVAQAPQAAAPAAPTLPRTGRDALAAALVGVALIATGLALRAHARRLV